MCHLKGTNHRTIAPLLHPGRWPQGPGERLSHRAQAPGDSLDGGEGLCLGQITLSNSRDRLLWLGLCRYFVTHPAGTFICIYSSWLTCHSPSSDVSIQGTIIYRIIDSQAPQGLPCQVTSRPLPVSPEGMRALSGSRPFLQAQPGGGEGPAGLALSLWLLFLLPLGVTQSAPGPPATGHVQMMTRPSPWPQINAKAAIASRSPALHTRCFTSSSHLSHASLNGLQFVHIPWKARPKN